MATACVDIAPAAGKLWSGLVWARLLNDVSKGERAGDLVAAYYGSRVLGFTDMTAARRYLERASDVAKHVDKEAAFGSGNLLDELQFGLAGASAGCRHGRGRAGTAQRPVSLGLEQCLGLRLRDPLRKRLQTVQGNPLLTKLEAADGTGPVQALFDQALALGRTPHRFGPGAGGARLWSGEQASRGCHGDKPKV